MRGYSVWNYSPYRPLNQIEQTTLPYICRLAPKETTVELEWLDCGCVGRHYVNYRVYSSSENFTRLELTDRIATIEGLVPESDYELYVEREDGSGRSDTRLFRTGAAVGTVVNYLHPEDESYSFSGRYLCSPSLVMLPSGGLLAAMDVFAGQSPQNLTLLFRSDDGGLHWRYVTELFPCFWGKLFCHRGELYMLATSTEYGSLIIGKSQDEGQTWSAPMTILPGGGCTGQGPHKAPMPVIEANGRLYTAIDYGSWKSGGHANGLLSIATEADLLVTDNWLCTSFLPFDENWEGAAIGKGGGLEGNAVVGPDGEIYNVLRYQMANCVPAYGKAVVLKGDRTNPEAPLTFQWFAEFNGGSNSKFDLLYDKRSAVYWAIVSEVVDETKPTQRNVLSLAMSRDLRTFSIVKRLLDYRHEDADAVGFQYVSFLIDGDDILYLSRTAINQAHNMHDSNYITFHRIERFRQYLDS
ncbi:hypothetical protein BK138_29745 [Paenibacillus rhizosphaerae]|uniref:Fibronectin type-III domain-containing protein n=1 Tax=Paenibacillus rhizosphaerae TaxID=297318 RepID=A0A1R1EC40_9BACL|nr:sialidase family protein [Paenibacillus rhizosphaerae]OMF49393.1 hypothetical protein BK138_29745 [Paenibacillus rhizosphaerae]